MSGSNQRKILFLSPFFYPEEISSGKYNSYLVEKLLGRGVGVDVVAFYPFYPDWVITNTDKPFKTANVYRFGEKVRFPKSQILRRISLEIQYTYFVIKYLFTNKKNYDVVISIFPPVIFMLLSSIFFKNTLKIGIIHDVQGIMATTKKTLIRGLSALIMGFIERLVYKKCDSLICLSHTMLDAIVEKYGISKEKCKVFYPFVSSPNVLSAVSNGALDEVFEEGVQHIVYSGALGEKQQPFDLYEFFYDISESAENIRCHIFSRGPVYNELLKLSKERGREKVLFHDLVDEKDLDALFHKSTVQVIPQSPGTGPGAFPSKLPNLLAHGVPVFAICDKDSELGTVIDKANSCMAINSWDRPLMVGAMHDFLKRVRGRTHESILLENKKSILKEFDVQDFIDSLSL